MAGKHGKNAKKLKQAKLGENFRKNKDDSNDLLKNDSNSISEEGTMTDTERGLKRKMDESQREFNTTVQKLEYELFELRELFEKQQTEIVHLKKSYANVEEKLSQEKFKTSRLIAKLNDLEQYQRRPNLRLWGIPEADNESADTSEKHVTEVIGKKLGIKLTSAQIQVAHRTGKFTPGAKRSIIVQLSNKKDKAEIMKKRKQLKGTGVTISEDLTPLNVRRLQQLKQLTCVSEAWSHQGKLFAKKDGLPQAVKEIPSDMVIDEGIFMGRARPFQREATSGRQPSPPPTDHAAHVQEGCDSGGRQQRGISGEQAASSSSSSALTSSKNKKSSANAMDVTLISLSTPKDSSTPK